LVVAAACNGAASEAVEATDVHEVLAGVPSDLAVTVYRAPGRDSGAINLDYLGGFALIRETRELRLPAGVSRVRFEGVADGIEPVSAIITGLADAVIEKNLDARLLSPATLLAAAAGKPVTLVRSNAKTGKTERVAGVIVSGADADGVVFQTRDGIEALRCSGLPESFAVEGTEGLTASPTLSVMIRNTRPTTQRIQLSYLAHGFDWAATYTATLSADNKTIDLGAWVTLANGNGVGFPQARTQVVAGRLNREYGDVEPIDAGGPVLARCWPQDKTSDPEQLLQLSRAVPLGFTPVYRAGFAVASPAAFMEVAVTGSRVRQEQLGDLKLYRVPQRTTVASRQSKQVRLLDRSSIPVHKVYTTTLYGRQISAEWTPASVSLRTRNDAVNHLGLPLPSGRVAVFQSQGGTSLLLNEGDIRDLALNEDVDIEMGTSSDVQTRYLTEQTTLDSANSKTIPLVPGLVAIRKTRLGEARRLEVSNARDSDIDFEIQMQLEVGARVVRSDHPLGTRNGHTVLRLKIPAHGKGAARFQMQYATLRPVRDGS
jgi:hypothetical protein